MHKALVYRIIWLALSEVPLEDLLEHNGTKLVGFNS